ncbi:penicillin-binding transpeptidase domain-containing protein [Gaopeijia maritima]|uniref:Penicillin-binding transpeptidase domain-containing protein n=1 Tax=Gaopeijia maritima TaxID=3119007 RepID=A0ABU9EBH4_9BACT
MSRRPRRSGSAPAWRRRTLLAGWLCAGALIVGRSFQVQVLDAGEWRERAELQHLDSEEIPAARGAILDRNGVPLVVSRERFEIAVATNELRASQKDSLLTILRDELKVPASRLRRVERAGADDREWVVLGSRFGPTARQRVRRFHGVHVTRMLTREMPYGDLALGLLGREVDGVWRGGIEQAFDEHLAGHPGREQKAMDNAGRAIPGQTVTLRDPVPGGSVTLTIDVDLQEISEDVLADAIAEHEARGGDLLVLDPFTGEVLALASIQQGNTNALSAINAPYEPGSTLKPFTVVAALEEGVAALEDSVDIGMGYWNFDGRALRDTHGSGVITFAEALQESSNIGIAKMALPLTPEEQYANLRDFGFGSPTGLPLPGETSGRLPHPEEWSRPTPQSLAIGYEISVTPLQMTLAYGALANGGQLMEPRIVRETTTASGERERFEPRVLRRVTTPAITREISEVLVRVVEDGTGTRAQLGPYQVAGKSGTAKIAERGGYGGQYFASFVGYFPADDPQIVVYAKLDAPRGGEYYGGAVAAPLIRATMEAALASRESPLSRARLVRSNRVATRPAASGEDLLDSRFVTTEGEPPAAASTADGARVPDVRGLTPRSAIRRLHAAGYRVSYDQSGPVIGTVPGAGSRLQPGDTVRLRVRGGGP